MAATALWWRGCWTKTVSRVRVAHDADPKGDAADMSERWKGARLALTPAALDGARLVVDALFGAGLSRPLEGAAAQIVEALNDLPVVAIDMPSGVSGDSGGSARAACMSRAALTVTFFRKKPGHLLLPGRALCGEIVLADIGIPDAGGRHAAVREHALALAPIPMPGATGHKYDRGHCVVVSGGSWPPARRGWRRAARCGSGAGLVSVASPPDALAVNAAHLTAIMLKPFEGAAGLADIAVRQTAQCRGDRSGSGHRRRDTRPGGGRARRAGQLSCWMPMR